MPRLPTPLAKPGLLVAEGRACEFFLRAVTDYLDLGGFFDVVDYGGINDLRTFMQGLVVDSGFSNVKALGVVRDAETSANGAVSSVAGALVAADLPSVASHAAIVHGSPRVGVFILPDGTSSGNLETLCADAVASPARMPCVEAFIDCLDGAGLPVKNTHKARVYAYISASDHPDVNLGIAVRQGEFDIAHAAFNPIRQFVERLADGL